MHSHAALFAAFALVVSTAFAEGNDRVKQASELILKLCVASGMESVEITKNGDSIEVLGKSSSVQIDRKESSGLVGGISKELTVLMAQQASEARSCAQKYLRELLDVMLKDDPQQRRPGSGQPAAGSGASIEKNPEGFWGGRGIWQDNESYCERLVEFLVASNSADNFRYVDDGKRVVSKNPTFRKIQGNYIIRTELGSTENFCGVFDHKSGYNAIACSRRVSVGRSDLFASVYNQTLKDMRDCLFPRGWKQVSADQGACMPSGNRDGECARAFRKEAKSIWLFSNLRSNSYSIGVQTQLGN